MNLRNLGAAALISFTMALPAATLATQQQWLMRSDEAAGAMAAVGGETPRERRAVGTVVATSTRSQVADGSSFRAGFADGEGGTRDGQLADGSGYFWSNADLEQASPPDTLGAATRVNVVGVMVEDAR